MIRVILSLSLSEFADFIVALQITFAFLLHFPCWESLGVVEVSIVMPCLNEAETLATCIRKAHHGAAGLNYEIIVADNGSTDGSQNIARSEGARVVDVPVRGYGAALRAGFEAAQGQYILMGDSDDSYDFSVILPFVEKLREGYQLVMGTRMKGKIKPGAMPFLHQYLGNPVLTFLGNLFFGCGLSDFHCGLRAFEREPMLALNLKTDGMEFASEMVIKATLANLKRTEIPITLYPDGRSRPPHLRTWRDGWRHLRFLLLYSPRWLFFYPGLILIAVGLVVSLALLPAPVKIGNVEFDVHTLLISSTLFVAGVQLAFLAVFARLYASRAGLLPRRDWLEDMIERFSLEVGLVTGLILTLTGLILFGIGAGIWVRNDFGELNYQETLRIVIPGTAFVLVGLQVFFYSFLISLLSIR
jgi:glycosyltransferase involved in cell wall biosynthesis